MVEKIVDRTFYHLSCTTNYKNQFTPNQSVRIGGEHTPFFAFYEKTFTLPIENPTTRTMEDVPAITWLRRVQQGTIAPHNLPQTAFYIVRHYNMLVRELIMEEVRAAEFPEAPSRQSCLYALESLADFNAWKTALTDPGTLCSLSVTGTIHVADSNLLLDESEPLSTTRARARSYWRGEMTADPRREVLIVGDVCVTAVGLSIPK